MLAHGSNTQTPKKNSQYTKILYTSESEISQQSSHGDGTHISKDSSAAKEKITVRCGSEEILVDREALCEASISLGSMSQKMSPGQEWGINMTNAPKQILRKLLEYVETRSTSIFNGQSNGTMFTLISLSHAMEMPEVETSLFSLMLQKSKSYRTIVYLWELANQYDNVKAIEDIVEFTQNHMNDMIADGFFKTVTWEQMCILMNNHSKDAPLDTLCRALLQWLRIDPSQKLHAPIVARHLDWKRLSNDIICRLVFTDPMFRKIVKYSVTNRFWVPPKIVLSALTQVHQRKQQCLATRSPIEEATHLDVYEAAWRRNIPVNQLSQRLRLLNFKPTVDSPVFLLVGATRYNSLATQMYFVKSKEWAEPIDINLQHRCDFGCAYDRQNIYILGGDRGDGHLYDNCFALNVYNYDLTELVDFYHPRCQAGVVVHGNELYVLGGLNRKHEAVSLARKVSLVRPFKSWKPMKNMKEKRSCPGVTVDPLGTLIVIGGHCCSCEYYINKDWVELAQLPSSYSNYGMHAIYQCQQAYAFRDFKPSEVCQFDMIKKSLKIKPTIGQFPDCVASMCCFENEIWTLTPRGLLYVYHIVTNTWTKSSLQAKELCRYFFLSIIDQDDVRPFKNALEEKNGEKNQDASAYYNFDSNDDTNF